MDANKGKLIIQGMNSDSEVSEDEDEDNDNDEEDEDDDEIMSEHSFIEDEEELLEEGVITNKKKSKR